MTDWIEQYYQEQREKRQAKAQKGGPGSGHHGHAGRPGKRGGSAPGTGGAAAGQPQSGQSGALCRAPSGAEAEQGWDNAYKISDAMDEVMPSYMRDWRKATSQEKGKVKDKLVTELAATSGESYETCNAIVKQWMRSSNDQDMRSLAIQKDAADEFGEELSSFTKGRIEHHQRLWDEYPAERNEPDFNPLYPSDVQRRVLRAEYDNTQKFLRGLGIGPDDMVTLYRGSRWNRSVTANWTRGQEVEFKDNVLASWSLDPGIADNFAGHGTADKDGVLLKVNVPARMIFSTALTGRGCLSEGEVVVVGGKGTVILEKIYRAGGSWAS